MVGVALDAQPAHYRLQALGQAGSVAALTLGPDGLAGVGGQERAVVLGGCERRVGWPG